MKLLRNIHWIIYSLFMLGCARQTTPTGGPKDSIPPTLINSIPKKGALNFKSKTIELTFSETIILNNPKEQLIITPDLGNKFDIKAKKNQVIITLEQDLKDSTTYSINFREAIQDITEKNPAEMLKLAFSTGTYIDSLSIEGTVYDLLKTTDIKDATVALYQLDTFDIFNHPPIYITKSDAKGKFKLENLKPGTYFIYGMEDKNKNLLADSKTEGFGFLHDSVRLTKNTKDIRLPFIHLDSRPLKLTSARPFSTYFNIKTSKNLTDFKITTPEDEYIVSSFGEDQANIRVYNTFQDKDSVQTHFTGRDSVDNLIDTTLYVKFSKRDVKGEPFDISLNRFNVVGTKGVIQGEFKFTKPVLQVNFDSIFYSIDSTQRISFNQDNLHWDTIHNVLHLEKSFDKNLLQKEPTPDSKVVSQKTVRNTPPGKPLPKPSNENQLYLGKAAFISIELDSSKKILERIAPSKLEDTGIILVEIQTQANHFFVELLTKEFNLVATKRDVKKFNFEDLKPGDYQLRLIIDNNNDGKWSPGNFYLHHEPETVIFYKNEKGLPHINLKANWELGPLLIKQ